MKQHRCHRPAIAVRRTASLPLAYAGRPSIPEMVVFNREAAAYWIARSTPGDDNLACGYCFARNDADGQRNKKPAVTDDGRLCFGTLEVLRPYSNATLTEAVRRSGRSKNARGGYMTSATTRPTPLARVNPTALAAPADRSSTRPLMNGPRSLIVTTMLRPPWVTFSLVPNGRER